MVRIQRVEEAHIHRHESLMVRSMLRWTVRWCILYCWFFSPFLFRRIPTPCLFSYFPASMKIVLDASPKFRTQMVSKSRLKRLHPICTFQIRVSFLQFDHWSSSISYFLKHDRDNIFSSVVILSSISFIVLLPHRSLLPHVALILLSFLLLPPSISLFCCCLFPLHRCFSCSVERHRQHVEVYVCLLLVPLESNLHSLSFLLQYLRIFISSNMESHRRRVRASVYHQLFLSFFDGRFHQHIWSRNGTIML